MTDKNWRAVLSNYIGKDKEGQPPPAPVPEKADSSMMKAGSEALEFLSSINFGSDSEDEAVDIPESERYEGDTNEAGQRCGIGTYRYPSGDTYEGQWQDNQRHGFGTQYFKTREKYQGQWGNDSQQGIGVHSWKTGEFFEGTYSSGKCIEGRYVFDGNKRTFRGKWTNYQPEDTGTLEIVNEGAYTGSVYVQRLASPPTRYDRFHITRHGKGEMKYKNGDSYKGYWHHDVREGFGVVILVDGTQFYGIWKSDKYANGTLIYTDGSFYTGEFKDGMRHGDGTLCFPNGDKISGEFSKDEIYKATFTKGSYSMVSRQAKTVMAAKMASPMREEEKQLEISKRKWKSYLDNLLSLSFNASRTTSSDILQAFGIETPTMTILSPAITPIPTPTGTGNSTPAAGTPGTLSPNLPKRDSSPTSATTTNSTVAALSSLLQRTTPSATPTSTPTGTPPVSPAPMREASRTVSALKSFLDRNSTPATSATSTTSTPSTMSSTAQSLLSSFLNSSTSATATTTTTAATPSENTESATATATDTTPTSTTETPVPAVVIPIIKTTQATPNTSNRTTPTTLTPTPISTPSNLSPSPTPPATPSPSTATHNPRAHMTGTAIVTEAIDYFTTFFTWAYTSHPLLYACPPSSPPPSPVASHSSSPASPGSPSRSSATTAQTYMDLNANIVRALAVDDITSFVEGTIECLSKHSHFGLSFEQRKKIHKKCMERIMEKVYPILFPLYTMAYRKEEAALMAKCKELSKVTVKDIGIHPKYCLSTIDNTPDKKAPETEHTNESQTTTNTDTTTTTNAGTTNTGDEPQTRPRKLSTRSSGMELMRKFTQSEADVVRKEQEKETEVEEYEKEKRKSIEEQKEEEEEQVLAALAATKHRKEDSLPYSPVIEKVKEMTEQTTPKGKMKAVLQASHAILTCVRKHYEEQGIQQKVIMGAEDKFPVLIFAVIKASIPLFAHYYFMGDFITEINYDPESVYRIEELRSVLKYICSLDYKIRDEASVLVPLNLLEKSTKWELKKGIEILPVEGRAKALSMLLKILLALGKRSEYGHSYPPLTLSESFDEAQCDVVLTYKKFFTSLLGCMGLRLEIIEKEKKEGDATEEDTTEHKNTEMTEADATTDTETTSENARCLIHFNIQYPLRVYTQLAEHLTEFYADSTFVATGKWDRPIYV